MDLSYWQVEITRYPKTLRAGAGWNFCNRFSEIFRLSKLSDEDREEGEELAKAYAVWVYMDMVKGRPVRLPKEERRFLRNRTGIGYEDREPKSSSSGKVRRAGVIPVRKHHIDTNEHVNNCQYVQMAMDYLPRDLEIRRLRVEYKKSAVLGDIIYPKVAAEDGVWTVVLENEENQVYAVIEVRRLTSARRSVIENVSRQKMKKENPEI